MQVLRYALGLLSIEPLIMLMMIQIDRNIFDVLFADVRFLKEWWLAIFLVGPVQAQVIGYLLHAAFTRKLIRRKRGPWMAFIFLFSVVTFPVYWWLYVRKPYGEGPT